MTDEDMSMFEQDDSEDGSVRERSKWTGTQRESTDVHYAHVCFGAAVQIECYFSLLEFT